MIYSEDKTGTQVVFGDAPVTEQLVFWHDAIALIRAGDLNGARVACYAAVGGRRWRSRQRIVVEGPDGHRCAGSAITPAIDRLLQHGLRSTSSREIGQ
jgi:hypothetical protein